MPEETHGTDGQPVHPEIRRETSEASFRAILFLLIAAMFFGVLIHVVIWFFFADWRDHENAARRSSFPLAPAASSPGLPAGPRLEEIDRMAGIESPNVLERFATKEAVLNSFGPTDEEGFVHIPIERAMKMLENKLPARSGPPDGQAWREEGLVDSGEPNSGRVFRGKRR